MRVGTRNRLEAEGVPGVGVLSLEPFAGGDWSPVMGMGDPGTACIHVDWDRWLAKVSGPL